MSDNLRIWKQVCVTDPAFAQKVTDGKGFKPTAINPMYQAQRATEMFGPLGIGWGHEEIEGTCKIVDGIVREDGTEKIWMVQVKLFYIDPETGARGEVSQWGSCELLVKTSQGTGYWKFDEDAPKKARTGAVSKCLSGIGFSADVWLKKYDNPEYAREAAELTAADKKRKSEENTQTTLGKWLKDFIGCASDDDEAAVVRWASVNGSGLPKYNDMPSVKAVPGASAELMKNIQEMRRAQGISYPEVLDKAKAAFPAKR